MKSIAIPASTLPVGRTHWTPERDIRPLLWLIERSAGDILEIGCADGCTTRILAESFPRRQIYAVDWSANPVSDTCRPANLCEQAAQLPNVHVIDTDSRSVSYPESIGFVYIDGDHSWDGVRADSERAFLFGRSHEVTIAWHDYGSNVHTAVAQYLDQLSEKGVNLCWVEESQIVFTRLLTPPFA